MTVVPELHLHQVARWCAQRVPEQVRDEIRIEHQPRGKSLTIVERRPPWKPELGPEWTTQRIAQLRYGDDLRWRLYWADRNGRWHPYDQIKPASSPGPLLDELDRDPTCIFWG